MKPALQRNDARQHSALQPCDEATSCPRCFNNIVDARGFVLMLTPKVATQSIVAACQGRTRDGLAWRSKEYVQNLRETHYIVGFVRNPFDRLVSCWRWWCVDHEQHRTWPAYGIRPHATFDEFVDIVTRVPHSEADKHWRPSSCELQTAGNEWLPHQLVRFESLAADFAFAAANVYQHCGVELGRLEHRNRSTKKHYTGYYSTRLIERVGDYYHNDLVNFGYAFGN